MPPKVSGPPSAVASKICSFSTEIEKLCHHDIHIRTAGGGANIDVPDQQHHLGYGAIPHSFELSSFGNGDFEIVPSTGAGCSGFIALNRGKGERWELV
ncbi:hypothetical protein LshimejAT787_2300350 [Lyophyllum shimeji]|uniref:Uncharacterized protein n=1 Tax=Lyophyllum shimeji TaxID=47721 RepID=A0A9P3UV46_LYOSH|nr:hypothetical protein LshimejAT787_2300350 [Lyophyllum shimeji]